MDVAEIVEEAVRVPCGPLELEGTLAYPAEGEPRAAVLVLAPHPHMGGRMDNNVVRHLARRAAEAGSATLRFNWRGVGASGIELAAGTSVYDHFEAMEREQRYAELLPDARAALAFLDEVAGGPDRLAVVGYSLGAVLAGMLAADPPPGHRPSHLACVSPPTARVSLAPLRGVAIPRLFVSGDRDFAFDESRFAAEYAALPEPRRHVCLAGADHFFRRDEERLWRTLAPFLLD